MTALKVGTHGYTGKPMFEIYDDADALIGCIYPSNDGSNTIHIVSKYFAADPVLPSPGSPPGYRLQFKERP